MASTYSNNLRLELIGDGEQQGTWGSTTNTNLGQLLEQAIGGFQIVTMNNANYTLTVYNGALDESRNAVLRIESLVPLTLTRNVVCPTIEKTYIVKNATDGGQSIVFKTAGGSGVTIPNGATASVYVNGTDVIEVIQNPVSITTGGTGANTASGARLNLGLGSMAIQNASAVAISGGEITGITDLAVADGGTGSSTAAGARTNLGLGTMATQSDAAVDINGGIIDTVDLINSDVTNCNIDSSGITGGTINALDAPIDVVDGGTGSATFTAGALLKGNGILPITEAVAGVDYLTNNKTITLSGDVSGSGATAITATLANTAVTPGSYTNASITVDAKGRVTSATSGTGVSSISGGTTGLTPATATSGAVTLGGTLALANGGTGATTQSGAANAVLPAQTANSGKFLTTNGTTVSWASVSGAAGGTVTSVDVSGGTTGLTTTGGPITGSGTITLSGTLAVANGGTGAIDQAGARTNLGLGTMATQSAANYLTSATAASTYLTITNAASTYLTTSSAASTYLPSTTAASTYLTITNAAASYQPLDGDLTSIGALVGTSGLLRKTAANTWELDTGTYLTSAAAAAAYQPLDGDLTSIAGLAGTSGILKKTAANTWTLDTTVYLTSASAASTYQPLDADLTAIAGVSGNLGLLKKTAADTWALDTNTYLTTTSATATYLPITTAASTYLTISNAASNYQPLDGDLTAIASIAGTSGLLKKTAANTWALDTASYLTQSDAANTYQPLDADLTSIASLTGTTGILRKTDANTFTLDTGISGTTSGTNTGDQNIFSTIAVSGQSNVVADTTSDTLTLAAGNNVSITTNASTDTVTVTANAINATSTQTANGTTTYLDFLSIPSWATRITITFAQIKISGNSSLGIRIGDSGGVENTGYSSVAAKNSATSVTTSDSTGSFAIPSIDNSSTVRSGSVVLTSYLAGSGACWVATGTMMSEDGTNPMTVTVMSGQKQLSGALDRVRIQAFSGDYLDMGFVRVFYE